MQLVLLQNELDSDVARFTTLIKPVLQQIRLLTGLNVGGKTRNIAIQLVLQQCCKTKLLVFWCPFFRTFWACLHEGGGPQVGEVTSLGEATRLSI